MTFFRSLRSVTPAYDPALPWPLSGLAYVIMFMGPIGAAGSGALVARLGLRSFLIGVAVGIVVTIVNGLLFDFAVEPLLARVQHAAQRPAAHAAINIAGFIWAIGVCFASMAITILILDAGSRSATRAPTRCRDRIAIADSCRHTSRHRA